MKLQVEYVPITEIKPYRRNAKLHPQEQIEQIKNSMKEFGNIDPIGVWHDEIVEGHGRYEALKQMGAKEIPIIRLDDLTDEQRKAYALVHNKLTMNSDFDIELLDMELAEIETIDMGLLGFEDNEEEESDNDIGISEGFNEGYNVIIQCEDLKEAEALAKLLHVDLDFTRQKIACKYSDISV